MMPPPEDDSALQSRVLDELLEYASRGQERDGRQRLGKPLPDMPEPEMEEELMPEEGLGGGMAGPDDPELPGHIPGMDPPEDAGSEGGVPGEEEMDPEALKAALAAMGG